MRLQPLNMNVVIQRDATPATSKGGIFIPENARERPREGVVLAVGAGRLDPDTGFRFALAVKPGDRVLFRPYEGHDVRLGDRVVTVIEEDMILAVVE